MLIDKNQQANQALAETLTNAQSVTLDLTDRDALRRLCAELENQLLDLAFINAGVVFPVTA